MAARNVRTLLLCAALLGACDDDAGTTEDPSTADDARVPTTARDGAADAAGDARRSDGSRPPTQDARVEQEAGGDEDARVAEPGEDASQAGEPDAAVVEDASMPSTGEKKPVFVAVGYSGTRIVSRDLGLTWRETAALVGGGDDPNLLRGVTFAEDLFVALGHNIFTSPDGATWTKRTNPESWLGAVTYGLSTFVACGGVGDTIYSADGVSWMSGTNLNNEHGRSVAFGGGKFMCATDKNNWWSTTDGKTWKLDSGGHRSSKLIWCNDRFADLSECTRPDAMKRGAAFGMNVWVAPDAGGSKLVRSTDGGKTWTQVDKKTSANIEGVAFGMAD